MNFWSVLEKSPQRIVTQAKVGESAHPISRILMFLLCCVPGFGALWFGMPLLPKTLSCQPDGSVAHCQEVQKLANIPVTTRSFVQPQTIAKPIFRELGGNNTLVYGGLAYIGGLVGIIALYSTLVVSRRVWVFDRHRQIIINEKYTAVRKTEHRYSPQDVFGIVVEINDITIDANADLIFVRLNLQSGAQPTRYQPFNAQQPIVYNCEYDRLPEAIDLVFDFDRQYIEIFADRDSYQIPFADIQKLEIERSSERERAIEIGEGSIDTDSYCSYTYRLLLVTNNGDFLPIHQIDSRSSSLDREREDEIESLTDNRGYRYMELLQQHLERLLDAVLV
jgi:hypothetical protein